MVFGFAAGRSTERWSSRGTLAVGLAMCMIGAVGLLATAALHLPLLAVVLSLVTMASGVAVTTPPATSLALAGYPDMAGTASLSARPRPRLDDLGHRSVCHVRAPGPSAA